MSASTALTYSPEWEPPDDDAMADIVLHKKIKKTTGDCHTGLKTVNIKAAWRNEDDLEMKQQVCKITVKNGGKDKIPGISQETLAQVITTRATEHARKTVELPAEISYKVTFYGDNDDATAAETGQKVFSKDVTFVIDTREDDEEEEEEEDETLDKVVVPSKKLEPAVIRNSIESELLQMMRISGEMMRIQTTQSGEIFQELRASMQQQRIDMCGAMQCQMESHKGYLEEVRAYLGDLRADGTHSRIETSKANARLVVMTQNSTAHIEGQQAANSQGWQAFTMGMQMKMEVLSQNMSWERQFMHQQMEQLAKEKQKETTESRKDWLKDFGPFILAGFGQILSSRGNPQGAVLQDLAIKAMSEDDEEKEDEDDDETPTPKTKTTKKAEKPTTVMGMSTEVDPREHFDKNQLKSLLHLLDSIMDQEQKDKLKNLVSAMAWDALQAALRAPNEVMTKSYLIQFVIHVNAAGQGEALIAMMTEEQAELYKDIAKLIQASMPGPKPAPAKTEDAIEVEATTVPPPPPPPPAGEPEMSLVDLRAMAKAKYGLRFAPRAGRATILKAIAEAEEE